MIEVKNAQEEGLDKEKKAQLSDWHILPLPLLQTSVPIYSDKSFESIIIGSYEPGKIFKVSEIVDDWLKVHDESLNSSEKKYNNSSWISIRTIEGKSVVYPGGVSVGDRWRFLVVCKVTITCS